MDQDGLSSMPEVLHVNEAVCPEGSDNGVGPVARGFTVLVAGTWLSMCRRWRFLDSENDSSARRCVSESLRRLNKCLISPVVELIRTACSRSTPPLSL